MHKIGAFMTVFSETRPQERYDMAFCQTLPRTVYLSIYVPAIAKVKHIIPLQCYSAIPCNRPMIVNALVY